LEPLKIVLSSLSADVEVVRRQARDDAAWLCTESGKIRIRLFYEQFPADKRKVNSRDIVDYIHSRTDPSSTSEQIDSQQIAAFRVLSSLLTFPLTLAYGLNKLFSSDPSLASSYTNMMLKDRSINVLVLGARAESSLPLIWWQEMLLSCDFDDVNLRMIGPELLEKGRPLQDLPPQSSSLVQYGEGEPTVRRSVTISGCGPSSSVDQSSDRTALHLHEDLVPLLQWAHVFALFNPGYGSKAMVGSPSDWDPTLRLLLQTRKPILCTAYGHQDLRRGESPLHSTIN
jgi:hypothetical protein